MNEVKLSDGYLGLFFIPFFWAFVIFGIGAMVFHSFGIMPFLAGVMLALALAKLKADYELDLKIENELKKLREINKESP
jgi:hypothetical protein